MIFCQLLSLAFFAVNLLGPYATLATECPSGSLVYLVDDLLDFEEAYGVGRNSRDNKNFPSGSSIVHLTSLSIAILLACRLFL